MLVNSVLTVCLQTGFAAPPRLARKGGVLKNDKNRKNRPNLSWLFQGVLHILKTQSIQLK